jgi:serine/threonine protein kinase
MAKSLVNALKYLHEDFHSEAMIIHRGTLYGLLRNLKKSVHLIHLIFLSHFRIIDLKPQNIGFTKYGTLKLLDFGLMACVKKRVAATDEYEMSGNTGTAIYMAPEVALRQPYTEKADIYSFGMILWQMTSGTASLAGIAFGNNVYAQKYFTVWLLVL